MKKNLKSIIVLAVILLALVSVVVFLTMSGKDTEDGTASSDLPVSSSSYDPITIIHSQYDIIGEITIINKEDEYTLIPKESDASDTSAASSSSEISFTIKGYEDYTLNQPGIDQLVASLTDVEASRELEDPMDLSEYGLADGGMSKVTVKYTDGASDEYIIGNETANDSGCYLLKNDKVYIVPFIPSTAVGSSLSFIDTQVFSITPDESTGSSGDSSVVLDRIELTGESLKEPVIVEDDENSINKDIITSPILADANY